MRRASRGCDGLSAGGSRGGVESRALAEAVDQIEAALAESSRRPAQVYRVLVRNLYRLRQFSEGAAAAARGLAQHPKDAELWNLQGLMLRNLGRYAEALCALDTAVKMILIAIRTRSIEGKFS